MARRVLVVTSFTCRDLQKNGDSQDVSDVMLQELTNENLVCNGCKCFLLDSATGADSRGGPVSPGFVAVKFVGDHPHLCVQPDDGCLHVLEAATGTGHTVSVEVGQCSVTAV